MTNFSWHEEESYGWQEPTPPEPPPAPRRWLRWLLLAGFLTAALVVGGTAVYRQANNRIAEVSFELESAVRTSHALVYQAAQQRDAELFVTLLSGRDADWAAVQEDMVKTGLLFGRNGFGLTWLPGDANAAVTAVTINPELNAAVLTATHAYAVDVGNGVTQTVNLLQTAVYRLGPDRWLISPPDQDFWGETLTSQGRLLTINYPERDVVVVRRLAVDLEAKIDEACARWPDLRCPADLHLDLNLLTNPKTLYESNKLSGDYTISRPSVRTFGWYSYRGEAGEKLGRLALPAPSLLGLPKDETSYQALYRGYAARLLSALVADLVGWECCAELEFFQATLEWQLAQLGLRAWPLQPADYAAALGKSVSEAYRDGAQGDREQFRLLVAFLAEEAGVPVEALLQRHVTEAVEVDWQNWLLQQSGNSYDTLEAINLAWLAFLVKHAGMGQTTPIPFPEEKLQLICRPQDSETGFLYAYYPKTGELLRERPLNWETAVLYPLPDRSGVVVAVEPGSNLNDAGVPFIWRSNAIRELPFFDLTIPTANDPQNGYILFSWQSNNLPYHMLLSVNDCLAQGKCDGQTLIGAANWSPFGEWMMLENSLPGERDKFMLFLATSRNQSPRYLGVGRSVTWLNDESLLFVQEDFDLVLAEIATLKKSSLLTLDDLQRGLDRGAFSLPDLRLEYAMGQPGNSRKLLVAAVDGRSSYYFSADVSGENLQLLQVMPGRLRALPVTERVSPNGRWLVQVNLGAREELWLMDWETAVFQSYDISNSNPTRPEWLVDWSADGHWLALVSGGYLRLIAPDHDFIHWVVPPGIICDQGVWVNG